MFTWMCSSASSRFDCYVLNNLQVCIIFVVMMIRPCFIKRAQFILLKYLVLVYPPIRRKQSSVKTVFHLLKLGMPCQNMLESVVN